MAIYKGDNTNNTINGSIGNDFIYGYGGNDRLFGLGGDDYIDGGDGNDYLLGGEGNDVLIGGNGIDDASYYDAMNGVNVNLTRGRAIGQGTDTLKGIENIFGSQFDDTLIGDAGANYLYDDHGNDKLFGLDGNDSIFSNDPDTNSHDILHGGNGDDLLSVYLGSATLYGDNGNDSMYSTFSFNSAGNIRFYGGKGNDTIKSDGNDRVIKNDWLDGGEGNDFLSEGGHGNSNLKGGEGNDTIFGGLGKDNIILTETTAATDTVIINNTDSMLTFYHPFENKNLNGVDTITDFTLSKGINTKGVDKIDLQSIAITANTAGVDGVNAGIIRSHAIHNGIISFDDTNTYSNALALSSENIGSVFKYLQKNFGNGETFAFNALGNTYLYQDDGQFHDTSFPDYDTVVQLNGVTATNLNTNGLASGGIWVV